MDGTGFLLPHDRFSLRHLQALLPEVTTGNAKPRFFFFREVAGISWMVPTANKKKKKQRVGKREQNSSSFQEQLGGREQNAKEETRV